MSQPQDVKISVADPTALGVLGLAMVTFVASSQKLGWTTGTGLVIPWAIFLGACAQWAASQLDFKKGNYFGATVLGAYGLFWFAVAFSWMIMNGTFGEGMKAAVDPKQLGFAFAGYFIFSFFVFIATLETNVPFMIMLFLIEILLGSLALSCWGIGDKVMLGKAAGWSEFFIALTGFYFVGANFLNNFCGRKVLPLGGPLGILKK